MAAFTSGSYLLDLPVEMFDLVMSYVPDVDLLNVRKVSVQFEDAFKRLICSQGRKLNFSRCYHLREEELMQVLELGRDYTTSVNVNHCYWLTSKCLKLIMKLPQLQELHMIDCRIFSLLQKRLIPVGLRALSLHWDLACSSVLGHPSDLGNEYPSQLFGNVKRLTVHIGRDKNLINFTMFLIGVTVLTHCLQLETLEVNRPRHLSYLAPELMNPQFQFPEGLLPKLSKLSVQLNAVTSIPNWVKAIFMQRKTPLSEVCLGMASHFLLESNPESVQLILPCINAEELPVVCLDSFDLSPPELPAIPKIWMDRKTPKCKVVSFQGLSLGWMSDTSKLVAEIGPQLQELNLRNCQVDINGLVMGLTTIAKHCTQLIKLDLTLDSSVETNDDSNNKLLIAVSEFKALKVLYMWVDLLSISKNCFNVKTVPGHQKPSNGSQVEISEELMRNSQMMKLTQSCMDIKDFRLTNDTWTDDRVVCESALACISNWKNLKELHLINIPTLGEGSFLPFITKNCPQLKNLYLANVCCKGTCIYMMSLIESLSHATALKDLSIIQAIELSSMLSNAFGKCQGLERMYLQSLVMKSEECDGFFKLLLELPKLFLVWIDGNFTTTDMINSTMKLNSLKGSRPSLIYSLKNRAASTDPPMSYKSFDDSWPLVHLELARYKTAWE